MARWFKETFAFLSKALPKKVRRDPPDPILILAGMIAEDILWTFPSFKANASDRLVINTDKYTVEFRKPLRHGEYDIWDIKIPSTPVFFPEAARTLVKDAVNKYMTLYKAKKEAKEKEERDLAALAAIENFMSIPSTKNL